jgi:hypothetical protein
MTSSSGTTAKTSDQITIDEIRPHQPCDECGRPTDPQGYGTLYSVEGWAERRRGGGLHHIRFKHETGKLMCSRCASIRRDTGTAQQGQLL